MSEVFKVGDKVIYNDPEDAIGGTGIYIIEEISTDKKEAVLFTLMGNRISKIKALTKHLEK